MSLALILGSGCLAKAKSPVGTVERGIAAEGRVRRLSHREYDNVIRNLLGDTTNPSAVFLEDSYTNGYDNGSADLVVQYEQVVLYTSAAETLAANAVQKYLPRLIGTCNPLADADKCKDAFLTDFVKRAYRRPPTKAERDRLDAVFKAGADAGGFLLGLETALEAVLQSPAFLYRAEIGDSTTTSSTGAFRLTDLEVASELSFLLTGSMPDDALFAAAESGNLHTTDDVTREGKRLLQLPAAKESARTFMNAWLATDRMATVTKDKVAYPSFNHLIALDMAGDTNLLIDYVLWNSTGSLRELFTSNVAFVDPWTAAIYGITTATTGRTKVDLDPRVRKGILTRAAYLSVHSAPDNSSPVARGVFFRQALLCAPLPPPPPDVLSRFMNTPPDPTQTTRERFSQHSKDPFCKGCHQFIDGIGFGFEEFDAIGRFRATENNKPVDSSGILVGTDIDGPFNGVSELASKLVESPSFERCATKQAFRYAMGRVEIDSDQQTIDALAAEFSVDRRFTDLLLAISTDRSFFYRAPEASTP